MRVGYARISSTDQTPLLQLDALRKARCKPIFTEKKSGRNMERPELARCLETLESGDTLVVWKLDRLGRSLRDLMDIIERLEKNGVQFISLTENIDTTTAIGKYFFHTFGNLAEFERNLIRERTMAGLAAARARGRIGGRKKKTTKKQDEQVKALWVSGRFTATEIAEQFNISVPTFWRRVRAKTSDIEPRARRRRDRQR
jgi:DNA invertase Pin-like site-specific DNA recombinase